MTRTARRLRIPADGLGLSDDESEFDGDESDGEDRDGGHGSADQEDELRDTAYVMQMNESFLPL